MNFELICALHESFIKVPWNGFMKCIIMNSILWMIHESFMNHSWNSWTYRFFMNVVSPGVILIPKIEIRNHAFMNQFTFASIFFFFRFFYKYIFKKNIYIYIKFEISVCSLHFCSSDWVLTHIWHICVLYLLSCTLNACLSNLSMNLCKVWTSEKPCAVDGAVNLQ